VFHDPTTSPAPDKISAVKLSNNVIPWSKISERNGGKRPAIDSKHRRFGGKKQCFVDCHILRCGFRNDVINQTQFFEFHVALSLEAISIAGRRLKRRQNRIIIQPDNPIAEIVQ
jgi:hypothetical protein